MTPPLKTEGVPGLQFLLAAQNVDERTHRGSANSRGGLLHRLSRAAGEQMGCQHYRSAAGPACDLDRTLRHRPPSDVFGRCVDDSCHVAGLGLALGLRLRRVALRRHRSAASRRGAVSLERLARLRRLLPEGSISTDSPRLVGFVLRVLCRYFMSCQSNEDPFDDEQTARPCRPTHRRNFQEN